MKKLAFVFVLIGILISFGYMHSASAEDKINTSAVTAAGWDKLTAAQQAEVLKGVADKVAASQGAVSPVVSMLPTAKAAQEWVDVAGGIGKGLMAMVKELGTTVNEFSRTPVGTLAMAMLVWRVMGNDIVHLGFGIILMCIWVPLWISMYRNYCFPKNRITEERTGVFQYKRTVEYTSVNDEASGWRITLLIALVVFSALNFWIL